MKGSIKVIIFYVVLISVLIIAITSILGNANNSNYTYGEIVEMFKQEKITECYVGNDNILYLKDVDGKKITYEISVNSKLDPSKTSGKPVKQGGD